jgi:hypothetical protein
MKQYGSKWMFFWILTFRIEKKHRCIVFGLGSGGMWGNGHEFYEYFLKKLKRRFGGRNPFRNEFLGC